MSFLSLEGLENDVLTRDQICDASQFTWEDVPVLAMRVKMNKASRIQFPRHNFA